MVSLKRILQVLDWRELERFMPEHERGRKGYGGRLLMLTLAGYMVGITSPEHIVGFFKSKRKLARLCGFKRGLPDPTTLGRLLSRLKIENLEEFHVYLIEKLFLAGIIRSITVAVDGSKFWAYANRKKLSDPDAKWGRAPYKGWTYGYGIIIACCADSEFPLAFLVSPANEHESPKLPKILEKLEALGLEIKYLTADKAFDKNQNFEDLLSLGIIPVLLTRKNRRRIVFAPGQTTLKSWLYGGEIEFVHDKYSCLSPEEWESQAKKRTASERVISRLKEFFGLDRFRTRGLENAIKHAYLSVLAMLLNAVAAIRLGRPDKIRSAPKIW